MPFQNLLKIKGSRQKRLPLLFECLLCKDKFTVDDVARKAFYVATNICKGCYKIGATTNAKIWCFGKLPKQRLPGYSPDNVACTMLCPDKAICVKFVNKLKEK